MKTLLKFFTVLFLFVSSSNLFSQSETDMKAWMDYMTPGSMHDMMAKSDGEWSEEITFWMDPTAPPMKTTGSMTNKMIMGGRYQYSSYSGDMMGMPFEGLGLLAYDNSKKVFESIWIDNMGSGIMKLQGPWDEATKSITLTGMMTDPLTGKDVTVKEIFKIVDENHQVMEMYDTKTGSEVKTMEIKFTRK